MTVKMPDPMTAPMPSAVSETGPSVFFSAVSGRSLSAISLSIDLVAKSCRGWRLKGRARIPRQERCFGMKRLYAEFGICQRKAGEAEAPPV
jgi:hypothetical protein